MKEKQHKIHYLPINKAYTKCLMPNKEEVGGSVGVRHTTDATEHRHVQVEKLKKCMNNLQEVMDKAGRTSTRGGLGFLRLIRFCAVLPLFLQAMARFQWDEQEEANRVSQRLRAKPKKPVELSLVH